MATKAPIQMLESGLSASLHKNVRIGCLDIPSDAQLLGLVVQVGVAFYVFLRSWARTPLTFLSIPMFVAGIIKFGERTCVLRSASKNHFRDSLLPVPDPGPDYADFMKGYSSWKDERQVDRTRREIGEKPLQSTVGDGITVPSRNYIDKAYFLFKNQFKHLYADLILSLDDQKTSEGIIRYMSSEDAFKVAEMELNFMYDVLYTKATVIYSLLGILLRSTSFSFTISTLAAFHFFIDKHEFSNIDIDITYLLLFGAIFLEVYALTKMILSDWSIVWLSSKTNSLADSIYRAITSFRSVITSDKRWSRRMAQNNLIDSCLRDKTKFNQVPRFLDMNKFLERYWYMTWEKVDDMKEPIFSLLLEMTNDVRDLRSLLKHRGDYVITKRGFIETLGWSIVDVEFDHSILLWHIATDLCSYSDDDPNPKSRCKISKCLSEYMLYLLVMCPFMLPKGIGEFRFRDTCSETKRFFQQRSESISDRNEACRLLLEVDTQVEPEEGKGDKSKSVLFEACRLAKELKSLNMEMGEKWMMVSHVWVEMLCYAASQDLCYPCDVDKSPDTNLKSRCEISKCLSEYMLYLLVMCPFMLPKGIGEFRFRDTCSETKRFFQQRSESISNRNEACRLLLEVDTEVEPKEVKGDKSKSVLFEACRLAKELKSLNMEIVVS
ncbi:uncharacterized protein LOC117910698 [Vitis riparia]|uniref:uncharacterized protein LOC117910698 n=1 Tax=Vitis riparia TaxID=96939 RepID=UPI00155B1A94|nr:uncharacterized protein LOC117910698 [Vitis riparia]